MFGHPIVRLLLTFLFAFSGLSFVLRVTGVFGLLVVVVLAGVGATVTWMLTCRRQQLRPFYTTPFCRPIIDVVCRINGCQPPVDEVKGKQQIDRLKLKRPAEYDLLAKKLCGYVIGHDRIIDELMSHLQSQVLLRGNKRNGDDRLPLGVYLLIGDEGIGKRFMAKLIGRGIYCGNAVSEFNMADFANDSTAVNSFLGNEGRTGVFLQSIRKKPYQTIILDSFDLTAPRLMEALGKLLKAGGAIDPKTRQPISFQHVIFFLVMSGSSERAVATQMKLEQGQGSLGVAEFLASEGILGTNILAAIDSLFVVHPLTAMQKAEVILQLMRLECRKYDIALDRVSPDILAEHVRLIDRAHGFSLAKPRVQQMLRDSLVQAVKAERPRISIERTIPRSIEMRLN